MRKEERRSLFPPAFSRINIKPAERLQPTALLKRRLRHWCFLLNFAKNFQSTFLPEHHWRTTSISPEVHTKLHKHNLNYAFLNKQISYLSSSIQTKTPQETN